MSQTSAVQSTAQFRAPWNAYLAVGVALFAFSLGPVWIRLAQAEGIPSLFIAVVRLTGATLFFTPLVLSRYGAQLRRLSRGDLVLGAAAGFWMAAHFVLVFLALENTTVLMNEVLGGTSMLWVALLESLAYKLRHGRQVWLGIAVSLTGGILIALAGGGSVTVGRNPALGGVLAIGGAIGYAFYLLTGRKLRAKVAVVPYVWLVYGSAAITSLIAVLFTRTPLLGYSAEGYFWTLVMTVMLQIVAHSSYNYALGYVSATYLVVMGQVLIVTSALIAFIVFGETPTPLQLPGSLAIAAGVILVSLGQINRRVTLRSIRWGRATRRTPESRPAA